MLMKRILCLILVFVAVFAVSCGGKKKTQEEHDYVEKVSKEIKAEEGGTLESSDGKISVEIPAGALGEDTEITMTIYESEGYKGSEDEDIITKVVELEPSGTIFKKPVIITMASRKEVKEKTVSAAVYSESEGEWSYSDRGAYVLLAGRDEEGVPVIMTAAGDQVMLNAAGDPIMMGESGEPIMFAVPGNPIMLRRVGEPTMFTAAGDPIMNLAAGYPVMMMTGHFTAFTFIAIDPEKNKPVETTEDHEMSDEDDEDEDPVSVAECGNGVVEKGEECDAGDDNGRVFCDYGEERCELCSLSCELEQGIVSYCGDGLIDSLEGETCDDGAIFNGNYAHCNASCSGPSRYCGDGHIDEDEGEICDDGTDNQAYGHCNAWCDGPAPYCGDGSVDVLEGEACDDGNNEDGDSCSADCLTVTVP